jgi:hypothetical protein
LGSGLAKSFFPSFCGDVILQDLTTFFHAVTANRAQRLNVMGVMLSSGRFFIGEIMNTHIVLDDELVNEALSLTGISNL